MPKTLLTLATIVILASVLTSPAQAAKVRVGGYGFNPYVINDKTGITQDLIKLLNKEQNKFSFVFTPTTSMKRFRDLDAKKFDIILFEDPNWGWKDQNVAVSEEIFRDGEIYIASDGKPKEYFDELRNKTMLILPGYHYGFADFRADRAYLEEYFYVEFRPNQAKIIEDIAAGQGEVGVVTISFLRKYLEERPALIFKLRESEKKDQEYSLRAIIAPHSPIKPDQFNAILAKLKASGKLEQFFKLKRLIK